MARSVSPTKFLTGEETGRINAAVAEAERRTSAEVKGVLIQFIDAAISFLWY